VARNVIEPLLEDIRKRHRDHPLVVEHLEGHPGGSLDNIGVARQAAEDGDEHAARDGPQWPYPAGVMPLMDRYRGQRDHQQQARPAVHLWFSSQTQPSKLSPVKSSIRRRWGRW